MVYTAGKINSNLDYSDRTPSCAFHLLPIVNRLQNELVCNTWKIEKSVIEISFLFAAYRLSFPLLQCSYLKKQKSRKLGRFIWTLFFHEFIKIMKIEKIHKRGTASIFELYVHQISLPFRLNFPQVKNVKTQHKFTFWKHFRFSPLVSLASSTMGGEYINNNIT